MKDYQAIINTLIACLFLMFSCATENKNQENSNLNVVTEKEIASYRPNNSNDSLCACRLNAYLKFTPNVLVYDTVKGKIVDEITYDVNEHEAGFNVDFDASAVGWLRIEDRIFGKSGRDLKSKWISSENIRTNIETLNDQAVVLYSKARKDAVPKDTIFGSQYNIKVSKCNNNWAYIEIDNSSGWLSPEDQCNLAETSCAGGGGIPFESEEDEELRKKQTVSGYTGKLWVFLGSKEHKPYWLSIGKNKLYHVWEVGSTKPQVESGQWSVFMNSIEITPQDSAYVRRLRLVDTLKIESLIPGVGKIKKLHLIRSENFKDILLIENAVKLLYALSTRDLVRLGMAAGLERSPPDKITFAPFAYIDTINNLPVSFDSLLRLNEKGDARHFWGIADGTGDSIILSAHMFFDKYVWDSDYLNADIISIDTIMKQKFYMQSITSAFGEKARYVEFFLEGTDDMGRLDWHGLRLVFVEHMGSYKIVGVVRGAHSF